MLELDLVNATQTGLDQPKLSQHLENILRRLNMVGKFSIEINLVGNTKIKTLNARFLSHNQPTDVLSFENPDLTVGDVKQLGSLVIATEIARSQAEEGGITLQEEVEILAGHGLLHLLGYHHN